MPKQTSSCRVGEIPLAEASKTVDRQLESLDPLRVEAFAGLQTARTARAAGYAREQKRLTLKYGADSQRVSALTHKIRFNDGLLRDLEFEKKRAKTEPPVADDTSYVFHGFVCDLKGHGIPRLTIALYDENKNWIHEMGYGCTDEAGYFVMRYQRGGRNPATDPKTSPGLFAADSVKRGAPSISEPSVRIYVLDSARITLQIEKEPLQPQLGEVDFRIIILGAEPAACTPPPSKPIDPPPTPPKKSTPLEDISGIGPARARKLRAAGIKDVETLLKTDPARLVTIAGFDARAVKREATAALKKNKRK